MDWVTEHGLTSGYAVAGGERIHFVETGAGRAVVFLHGNPTSSFLWRKVLPGVAAHGRCVAPDLVGFGRSGKPDIVYRFRDHRRYLEAFLAELGLRDVVLVLHDWGAALGLDYAARHPERVAGVVLMEPVLMGLPAWDRVPPETAQLLRALRDEATGPRLVVEENLFLEVVLPQGIIRRLEPAELDEYRAPFAAKADRRPLLQWPRELPVAGEPADVADAMDHFQAWLRATDIPVLLVRSAPGTPAGSLLTDWAQSVIANAQVATVGPALHFLQEDDPDGVARAIAGWLDRSCL